jgi:aspartate aminotransferase
MIEPVPIRQPARHNFAGTTREWNMTAHRHVVDTIPLGGIVTVRDQLLERQASGHRVFRLESGDPSFAPAPHILEAIKRALDGGQTHYTAAAGIRPLREAIFRKLCNTNRIPVSDPDHVLVTHGAMNALYVAFRAVVQPGDEVIMPDPTWTETADNVRLAGGVACGVTFDPEDGEAWADAVEAAVTPRTRAIVVNSPHNPTGAVLSREALTAVVRVAERHGLWVISDEAYEHVIHDGREHVSPGALGYDRVVSIFSMSKSYALSGLRVGYLACNDDLLIERMTKLLRCTINGANAAMQHGAIAALEGPQDAIATMAREYQHRRDLLWDAVRECPVLRPFKPEGAFYLWARIGEGWSAPDGRGDGWAMTEYLIANAAVGSAPGEVFGPAGAGHIRFAFSCSTDQIEAAAGLIRQWLG